MNTETPAVDAAETPAPAGSDKKQPRPVTGDELAQPLIDGMPVPGSNSEESAGGGGQDLPPEPERNPIDRKGVVFNPSIHAANSDGTPKTTKDGNFYSANLGKRGPGKFAAPAPGELKFKGAGKSGDGTPFGKGNVGVIAQPPRSDAPAAPAGPDRFDGAAKIVVPMIDGIAQMILSGDAAMTKEEINAAVPVTAEYMRSKGTELSPGWCLVLVACAIYGPKLQKPTVGERIKKICATVKGWFTGGAAS